MSEPTCDSDRNDLLLSAIERLHVVWLALQAPQGADVACASAALSRMIADIQHDIETVHSNLTS